MDVHVRSEERLRAYTNSNRIFVDVSTTPLQQSLTVQFYDFQKQIIKYKVGTYKIFVFEKNQDISNFDFGFWADAETIWQSF